MMSRPASPGLAGTYSAYLHGCETKEKIPADLQLSTEVLRIPKLFDYNTPPNSNKEKLRKKVLRKYTFPREVHKTIKSFPIWTPTKILWIVATILIVSLLLSSLCQYLYLLYLGKDVGSEATIEEDVEEATIPPNEKQVDSQEAYEAENESDGYESV